MVKISFNNEYGDVLADKSTIFFLEKLENFEKLIEQVKLNESYQFSKENRLLADFWSTNADGFNIDEDDESVIIEEKEIELNDHFLKLNNPYKSKDSHLVEDEAVLIFARRIVIKYANIEFGGRYNLCAQYRMEGMCYRTPCDWYTVPYQWINNPVIAGATPSDSKSWQADVYDQDWLETKAWVQIAEYDRAEDVAMAESRLRSSKVINHVMNDIYEALS